MGRLFDRVRAAVASERVVVGVHADDMLRERGIAAWQLVAGIAEGRLLRERPKAMPNSIVEVEQALADGTPVKCVWSFIAAAGVAKLVTVHFINR